MNILQIVMVIFIIIESLNITTLYFNSDSKIGNGLGVFDDLHKVRYDKQFNPLVTYLINWVAGTKLIFVMLGIVVVIFGDETIQLYSVYALIVSILSFYWRLFPSIQQLDEEGRISPKGYSKTLNIMIISFLAMFAIALIIYFIF